MSGMKAFGWIVKGKRGVDGIGLSDVEGVFPRTNRRYRMVLLFHAIATSM